MEFRFEVLKTDPTGARLGRLTTPHGVIDTPAFVPIDSVTLSQLNCYSPVFRLIVSLSCSDTNRSE